MVRRDDHYNPTRSCPYTTLHFTPQGIHVNAGDKLTYQYYDASLSYNDANSEIVEDEDHIWYANVVNYLNWASPLMGGANKEEEGEGGLGTLQAGWWTDVIDLMFWEGYSVHDYDIGGGDEEWYANFALLNEGQCPIKVNDENVMKKAENSLVYASMEMSGAGSRNFHLSNNGTLSVKDKEVLDVMSYSSSFWTSGIVESATSYFFLKETIPTGSLDGETVYLNDGGLVDTTGIVTLLQKKEDTIVAFYNNNDPLSELSCPFAFLFGAETSADSMNCLEGWELGQVFDSGLWEGVKGNLTDGGLLRAKLENVEVKENEYLGVEAYILKNLIIFSNERSDEFLGSFEDEEIAAKVDDRWPNNFPVSMPTLDANVMCMFKDWIVEKYLDELKEVM